MAAGVNGIAKMTSYKMTSYDNVGDGAAQIRAASRDGGRCRA